MKKKTIYLLLLASAAVALYGCYNDKGNYTYTDLCSANITLNPDQGTYRVEDTLRIDPQIAFLNADSLDAQYEWNVNGKVVSTEHNLEWKIPLDLLGQIYGSLSVIKKSNQTRQISTFSFKVTSEYTSGWYILAEKDGESQLHYIRYDGTYADRRYALYRDLYRTVNGKSLGSEPVGLRFNYGISTQQEIVVMQNGGQKSVSINGTTMVPVMTLESEFLGGAYPSGFQIKDYNLVKDIDFIIDKDNNLYKRNVICNQAPKGLHKNKFNATPVYMKGGFKVSKMEVPTYRFNTSTSQAVFFDPVRNRFTAALSPNWVYFPVLEYRDGLTVMTNYPGSGGYTKLPATDYPHPEALSTNLQMIDFGFYAEYENTDTGLNFTTAICPAGTNVVSLLKDKTTSKIYLHTFASGYVARKFDLVNWGAYMLIYPVSNIEFSGAQYVTEKTKIWPCRLIRGRDARTTLDIPPYILFTGGANNSSLYYYNFKTKTCTLVNDFGSPINTMHAGKFANGDFAVGLENGSFIIFDIQTANLGITYKEIYRVDDLGRVVSVIWRYLSSGSAES